MGILQFSQKPPQGPEELFLRLVSDWNEREGSLGSKDNMENSLVVILKELDSLIDLNRNHRHSIQIYKPVILKHYEVLTEDGPEVIPSKGFFMVFDQKIIELRVSCRNVSTESL